eukprot:COSAG06_NODE_187_length_20790_cov_46.433232_18_plen_61_part_00
MDMLEIGAQPGNYSWGGPVRKSRVFLVDIIAQWNRSFYPGRLGTNTKARKAPQRTLLFMV